MERFKRSAADGGTVSHCIMYLLEKHFAGSLRDTSWDCSCI